MQSTRRTFLGAVGAAATAAAVEAKPRDAAKSKTPAGSDNKCLFWIAAATPCDKNLKFDDGAYRDMLSYFKENGAHSNDYILPPQNLFEEIIECTESSGRGTEA